MNVFLGLVTKGLFYSKVDFQTFAYMVREGFTLGDFHSTTEVFCPLDNASGFSVVL